MHYTFILYTSIFNNIIMNNTLNEIGALPLPRGSVVGKITATAGGEIVAESDLVTTSDLTEKSYLDIVGDLLRGGR